MKCLNCGEEMECVGETPLPELNYDSVYHYYCKFCKMIRLSTKKPNPPKKVEREKVIFT